MKKEENQKFYKVHGQNLWVLANIKIWINENKASKEEVTELESRLQEDENNKGIQNKNSK